MFLNQCLAIRSGVGVIRAWQVENLMAQVTLVISLHESVKSWDKFITVVLSILVAAHVCLLQMPA